MAVMKRRRERKEWRDDGLTDDATRRQENVLRLDVAKDRTRGKKSREHGGPSASLSSFVASSLLAAAKYPTSTAPVKNVCLVHVLQAREELVRIPQHRRLWEQAALLAVADEAVEGAAVGVLHLNEEVLLVFVAVRGRGRKRPSRWARTRYDERGEKRHSL